MAEEPPLNQSLTAAAASQIPQADAGRGVIQQPASGRDCFASTRELAVTSNEATEVFTCQIVHCIPRVKRLF